MKIYKTKRAIKRTIDRFVICGLHIWSWVLQGYSRVLYAKTNHTKKEAGMKRILANFFTKNIISDYVKEGGEQFNY